MNDETAARLSEDILGPKDAFPMGLTVLKRSVQVPVVLSWSEEGQRGRVVKGLLVPAGDYKSQSNQSSQYVNDI